MKEKDLLKITDKMDLQGKKKFILKNGILWGLFMFVVMTIFQTFFDIVTNHISFFTYIASKHFLYLIIAGLILFPLLGYFFKLWEWEYHHKKKEKMMRNK